MIFLRVIDMSECMGVSDFNISINDKVFYDFFKTRHELSINNFIIDELNRMSFDKLRYLYFDCFDEHEFDIDKIIYRITDEVKNNFDSIYGKIYDFLKLTSINK